MAVSSPPSQSPSLPSFPDIAISHLQGQAQAIHYRKSQLHRLHTELVKSKEEIKATNQADVGHTAREAEVEFALVLSEIRQHHNTLDPVCDLAVNRRIETGEDNLDRCKSVSIAYIVPSTHTLLYSVLSPCCAAIAAGCCVIVELPHTLRSLTSTLRRILSSSLDPDTFAISERRPATEFLQQCTLVLPSQSDDVSNARRAYISPSSLRAVAFVDRTADISAAAHAVIEARFSRRGSSPYGPDVVLVNEFVLEEFLVYLVRHISPYMAYENGSTSGDSSKHKQHWLSMESQRILDTAEKSEDMRLVVRGSNGSIVTVQNRDAALLGQKISGPVLVIHAISSLDDGIDFTNQSTAESTLAASYIFATLPEANYLANFVDAYLSCVNQIPVELLVGPIAPLAHAPSLSPRFTQAMFQEPRPQLLHRTKLTSLLLGQAHFNDDFTLNPTHLAASLQRSLEAPLPPMNRKTGRDIPFFLQAVMTGGSLVALSVLVSLAVTAKYVLPFVRQRP